MVRKSVFYWANIGLVVFVQLRIENFIISQLKQLINLLPSHWYAPTIQTTYRYRLKKKTLQKNSTHLVLIQLFYFLLAFYLLKHCSDKRFFMVEYTGNGHLHGSKQFTLHSKLPIWFIFLMICDKICDTAKRMCRLLI